jgi:inosose dehydratase
VFEELASIGYEGWWVVEAEQDPSLANPLEYAIKARKYIREKSGV